MRLIPTSPYTRNISLARLRNHRQFAKRFLTEARQLIAADPDQAPDRIVVSLPPLGTADAAFSLREELGGSSKCQVIVDIMDAWPETFYRVLGASVSPWLREKIGRVLFAPLHRTATRAYTRADRISAVSQIYIDLAKARRKTKDQSQRSEDTFHLCYHGIDLQDTGQTTNAESNPSFVLRPSSFVLTYIGALERSYDLETAIRAVHELNSEFLRDSGSQREKNTTIELHIAGAGTNEPALKNLANSLCASVSPCLCEFHGLLHRDALAALLASSHAGLIPMRQNSFVGFPSVALQARRLLRRRTPRHFLPRRGMPPPAGHN